MTIAKVSDASSVRTAPVKNSSGKDSQTSFMDSLSGAMGKGSSTAKSGSVKASPGSKTDRQPDSKTDSSDKVSPAGDKDVASARDKVTDKTVAADNTEVQDKDKLSGEVDQLKDTAEKIREIMKKALGIDDDQLDKAMEEAGVTGIQLVYTQVVVQVTVQVTGQGSPADILTDENLSSTVTDMLKSITALTENLSDVLKNLISDNAGDHMSSLLKSLAGENEPVQTVNIKTSTETLEIAGVDVSVTSEETVSNPQTVSSQTEGQLSGQSGRDSAEEQNLPSQNGKVPVNAEQPAAGTAAQPQNVFNNIAMAVADAAPAASSNPVDVVSQIVDRIKTVVKQDTTSMELTLNPESLGKVSVQITSSHGVMTAQFTAQSEAARHAIESQLQTLKDAFNNQGLKVEAVEVAVNPQGFDMNQQQNPFEDEHRDGGSRRGRRGLRLDDLTEDEAEDADGTSESGSPAGTGSQVDYTA